MNETATTDDALSTEPTAAPKKTKPAKKVGADAKKPSKAVVTKPAAKKAASKDAKPAKKAASKDTKPAKKADAAPKPKKTTGPAPSTQQPEDKVVLKAVEKLKEPEMASKFAADLGVHRRVIRAQLQRLAKDKANGVSMVKKGPHWIVAKK